MLLEHVVGTWATLYLPSNPRREVERELGSISCLLVVSRAVSGFEELGCHWDNGVGEGI